MYPIWIRDGQNPKPDADIYYELAANGLFLPKQMPFWTATVQVDRISVLEEETPSLNLRLPTIPKEIVTEMARFFAWVYKKHGTEAMVLVWFSDREKKYRISAPTQQVSASSLRYEIPNRLSGEYLVGTFHSHGNLSAFHSGTDQCDEKSLDGIHGTFGNFGGLINGDKFSLSLQAAVNGTRFPLEPVKWLEGIKEANEIKTLDSIRSDPKDAEKKDDKPKLPLKTPRFFNADWTSRQTRYVLEGNPLLPDDYMPLPEWVQNVKTEDRWRFFGSSLEDGSGAIAEPAVGDGQPGNPDLTPKFQSLKPPSKSFLERIKSGLKGDRPKNGGKS